MASPKKTVGTVPKGLRETFANFFEDPSRDKLSKLLADSGGEFKNLDFKVVWPTQAALAKQVLALGNSGGGCLIAGVAENSDGTLNPEGLEALTDKSDITGWLKGYVPTILNFAIHDFNYPGGEWGALQGKKFQAIFVEPDEDHLPFVAIKGGEKLVAGGIYIRREGQAELAGYEEVQRLINARIEGGRSTQSDLDLKAHFEHLKTLYSQIERQKVSSLFATSTWARSLVTSSRPNPKYPTEDFESFVIRMIERKKGRIEDVLDLRDLG